MKKKIEKKIAKAIVKQMKEYANKVDGTTLKSTESVYRAAYDAEVSASIRSFLCRVVEQPGIVFDVRDEMIYISCRDVKKLKTAKFSGYSDEHYMEIQIDSEGFSISYGHQGRSYYEDKDLLKDTIRDFEDTITRKNKEYLERTIENIYSESGLIRDNNLDTLLN